MQDKINDALENWRWKMIRKIADYINQPDDINKSELNAMIESYQNYHELRSHIQPGQQQHLS